MVEKAGEASNNMRRTQGAMYEGVKFKSRSYGSQEIRKFDVQKWMATPLKTSLCKCGKKYLTKLGCVYCRTEKEVLDKNLEL